MSYSQLILRDSAEIVWPLDDITESSSISKPINFFTNSEYAYSASINLSNTSVVNIPVVFGGGSCLSFNASSIGLSIPAVSRFSELYENKDSVISFWFQPEQLSDQETPIFKKRGSNNVGLFIKDNYLILKYGTSASYSQVQADIFTSNEPNHVVAAKTSGGLYLVVNGTSYSTNTSNVSLEEDPNHSSNDYIDFYGPPSGRWTVDSIAIYSNMITDLTAKRHYVYGLGKNIPDDVFYARGGNLYNFSTIATERLADINWDYPDEWQLNNLIDLYTDNVGIRPLSFSPPALYSFDNNIDTSANVIKFSSSSVTQASYIQIDRLFQKIQGGEYPFFVKVKLNGQLPDQYISQRILSYGRFPDNEIIKFNLYNDGGQYKINVSTISSASTQFTITNPISASSIYIGLRFTGYTSIYFVEQGKSIQTASFSYQNADGFGLDPLLSYFPPGSDTVIRLGSSLNYDNNSFNSNVPGVEQFYGTVEKFIVAQKDFVASANYSYLDQYNKPRYEQTYNSSEKRFIIKTYGYGDFNVHTTNVSEYITDEDQRIGSNIVRIGYPDILSSSQVLFHATLIDYDGNIVHPRTKLNQSNYLNYLNNTNIANMYIKFDFEILSEDSIYYPPRIKSFQMQTFKSSNNSTIMRDEAGENYKLYPTSSSVVYLPEIRYTPSIFLTNQSGIKLDETQADFTENILPKPLDPRTIDGLKLWLDARFINGLDKVNPADDSRLISWSDLSDNSNNAVQQTASIAPVFRTQSLNLLRYNQLSGADTDNLNFIISSKSSIQSSSEGAVTGNRGIKVTPDGTSTDSYIDVSFNTASISTFANQAYSVVGSIKLEKPQTSSALNVSARKIVVFNVNSGVETFAASSFAATNSRGVYSLSAVFLTTASTTGSRIRFYNGSSDLSDTVYWDNLGVYPVTASSSQYSWVQPLTLNDSPVVKFDGRQTYMQSSASVTQPYTLYAVGRNFNNSVLLSYSSSAALYSQNGYYYFNSGSAAQMSQTNKEFNVYSAVVSSGSARFYVNGKTIGKTAVGNNNILRIEIGRGRISGNPMFYLSGDLSSLLLYSGNHGYQERSAVENWLDESFNLIHNLPGLTPLNDIYTAQYTEYYGE